MELLKKFVFGTEKPMKLVHRPAKAGEYIQLRGTNFTFNEPNEILLVTDVKPGCAQVRVVDHINFRKKDNLLYDKEDYLWNYCHSCYDVITYEEE